MYKQLKDKTFQFTCDLCGEVLNTGLKSFTQARNVSQVDGWQHRPSPSGGWFNLCPSCSDESDPGAELAGLHFYRRTGSDD